MVVSMYKSIQASAQVWTNYGVEIWLCVSVEEVDICAGHEV